MRSIVVIRKDRNADSKCIEWFFNRETGKNEIIESGRGSDGTSGAGAESLHETDGFDRRRRWSVSSGDGAFVGEVGDELIDEVNG